VTRQAAFAQDEWNVSQQWSVYAGGRYETIGTESAGTALPATHSRSGVWSPVAQTLYKFPDQSGRQLRMALTRTYKAPETGQLNARRYEAAVNTRFNPDRGGNPALRPELATGLDLTYEHFWAEDALFSVGASARHITDYIRTRLGQDANGSWLSQPVNDGRAQVRTLDMELKFPLKAVWTAAPAVDLRSSVNRNWSRVESVPGPDNRLDRQVPLTAVLGIDYTADKYSTGANFSFSSGGPVRISEQQSSGLQRQRDLEAYLLYRAAPGMQWRATASNLLARDYAYSSSYQDSNGVSQVWGRAPNPRRLSVNLDVKF
jgi:outer membrane receptor protein involved in Fe transport